MCENNEEGSASGSALDSSVRLRSEYRITASRRDSSDSEDYPHSPDLEAPMEERRLEMFKPTSSLMTSDDPLVKLRSGKPMDNQYLTVEEEKTSGDLTLTMAYLGPQSSGVEVFRRRRKFSELRMDDVYIYTSILFKKSVGVVLSGATPSLSFLDPPSSPVADNDPRLFAKIRSAHNCVLLQPACLRDPHYLSFNAGGQVTLSKLGSPLQEFPASDEDEVDCAHLHISCAVPDLALAFPRHGPGLHPPIVADFYHHSL